MAAPLILASASPRRRELLQQMDIDFRCQPADIDETPAAGESPESYVMRMALEKALAIQGELKDSSPVIIGADTIVHLEGEIMGKPVDEADAVRMLVTLAGKTHQVYSAVCVVSADDRRCALSTSQVSFRQITPTEARRYWTTGEPRDKAGAYAIQGLAAAFVTRLDGSYSGVMGLPLFETSELLREFGIGGSGEGVPA